MLDQDCEAKEEKISSTAEACTTQGTTLDDKGNEADVREPPKKYYDIDEIWAERASPDDELTRYTLALHMGKQVLVAHMIVDPLLDITTKEIEYMKKEGFVEQKRSSVLRKELLDEDIRLLRKSQWINPDDLS
jgi:hypothetical protein